MVKKGITILLIAGLIIPAYAKTIHVDDDVTIPGNGEDWSTAFNDLQAALAPGVAEPGDEIHIAGGVYKPSTTNPYVAFQLIDGVVLRGGYVGVGDIRDFLNESNRTVLSGDLGGGVQSVNVISALSCEIDTVLDGITVTGSGDSALVYGRLTIVNCTFSDNQANNGAALMFVSGILDGCKFERNSALWNGGAIFVGDGMAMADLTMTDCVFIDNTAGESGGAIEGLGFFDDMVGFGTIVSLANCVFTQNIADVSGGAIHSLSSNFELINCTLAGNVATNGSAVYSEYSSNLTVTNCIVWGEGATTKIGDNDTSTITVSYSDIQGGWVGTGNIDTDPMFVSAPFGADPVDLHLTIDSPCVDAGNSGLPDLPPLDLDGTARIKGPAVDMGAYELAVVIPASVDLFPRILYKNSTIPWMFAVIDLPTGYGVDTIVEDSVAIMKIENMCCPSCPPIITDLRCDLTFTPWIIDLDWDGIDEMVVMFNQQDLLELLGRGFYRIKVSGDLETSERFQGSETICVIGFGI